MLGHETTEFSEVIAWSPTRDLLAYAIGRPPYSNTDLYALDPTTGEDRMLFSTGSGEHARIVSDLAWSPSGRWLAVAIVERTLYLDKSVVIIYVASKVPKSVIELAAADGGEVLIGGTAALIGAAADRPGIIDQKRTLVAGQTRSRPKSEFLRRHRVAPQVVHAHSDPDPIRTWERLHGFDAVERDVSEQPAQPVRGILKRRFTRGGQAGDNRSSTSGRANTSVRSDRSSSNLAATALQN